MASGIRSLRPVVEPWDLPFREGAGVELEGGLPALSVGLCGGSDERSDANVVLDGQQDGAYERVVVAALGPAFSTVAAATGGRLGALGGWVDEVLARVAAAIEHDAVGCETRGLGPGDLLRA